MLQDPTTVQRLMKLRMLTKNYYALRGLQVVPFGIFLLALSVFDMGWVRLPDVLMDTGIAPLAAVLGFLSCFFIYGRVGDYYDRTFGRVDRARGNPLDNTIWFLAILVLIMGAIRIDIAEILPISAIGLALALWFFAIWWRTDAFRLHILILALLTLLVDLLPLVGLSAISRIFLPGDGAYDLVLGLFLTIGGLGDHYLLVQRLGQRQWPWSLHDQTV